MQINKEDFTIPKDSGNRANKIDAASNNDIYDNQKHQKSIADFTLASKLGEGGYGQVYRAISKTNNKEYAIKVIKKKLFGDSIRVKDALIEKKIMAIASNPFIVKLHYAFQDKKNIYYAMDYVCGGILLRYMKYFGRFTEDMTRFYIGQVILALKYLHEDKDIVYRDLKPENILVDEQGYIKLTDFGLSSMGVERLTSICGTYEYIAPEMLRGEEYTELVDYFSLGCLMYEMLYGFSPFNFDGEKNRHAKVIKHILENKYTFDPSIEISKEAKDLITNLLSPNPKLRLGSRGAIEIQSHPFFASMNWDDLYNKKIKAPIKVDIFKGSRPRNCRFGDNSHELTKSLIITSFEFDSEEEKTNSATKF